MEDGLVPNRLDSGVQRGEPVEINFDGQTVNAYQRETIATALIAAGYLIEGWTLPGMMTAGGLQRLVVNQRLLPGKRFLLAGCSPLLLSVAANLVSAGAEFVGVAEATTLVENLRLVPEIILRKNMWWETISQQFQLFRRAVKMYRPYTIVAAEGDTRIRTATIARLDKNWVPISGSETQIDVDIIGLGYGFLPQARLARLCGCDHVNDGLQLCWKPQTDQYMKTD